MKKVFLGLTLLAFLMVPLVPSLAYSSGYYTFRSTVTGSGIHNVGNNVYQIVNEKTSFDSNESVHFLSRIFNISNVGHFKFKHIVSSNGYYQEHYSHDFWPNRNWWAEVYYWKDLGRLANGSYELRTYINIDNRGYEQINTRNFQVGGYYTNYNNYDPYYQPAAYYPVQYNTQNYYQNPNYTFNWMKTGVGITKYESYKYRINTETTSFQANQDVYSLVYLSNIQHTDRFQIKYEVYGEDNRFLKRKEVPVAYPHNNRWEYNYSWANLGKLPHGRHEVRAYISVNGGTWKHLTSRKIEVGNYYDKNYNYNYNYQPHVRNARYNYGWTKAGTHVNFLGNYKYSLDNTKSTFYTDEEVKVLTHLYEIYNIDTFRIKHKLYRDNSFVREKLSSLRNPNDRYWAYNYYDSSFGKLSSGNYIVKVLISIDGGTYKHIGTQTFTVKERYNYSNNYYHYNYPPYYDEPHYVYGGTITGTGNPTKYYDSGYNYNTGQHYNYYYY